MLAGFFETLSSDYDYEYQYQNENRNDEQIQNQNLIDDVDVIKSNNENENRNSTQEPNEIKTTNENENKFVMNSKTLLGPMLSPLNDDNNEVTYQWSMILKSSKSQNHVNNPDPIESQSNARHDFNTFDLLNPEKPKVIEENFHKQDEKNDEYEYEYDSG